MKKQNSVIIEFKFHKLREYILFNHKNLKEKYPDLTQLKFLRKLSISESMYYQNH